MTVMFSRVRLLLPAPKSRGWPETGFEEIGVQGTFSGTLLPPRGLLARVVKSLFWA
jgi:hypothetical protein